MRERTKEVKTLFTTCSGGMVAAAAGLLDGVTATTNHGAVPLAQQLFSKVNWTREKQWVVDGKFWTAGGACAGMDMFAPTGLSRTMGRMLRRRASWPWIMSHVM